jgi:hypothetical protein
VVEIADGDISRDQVVGHSTVSNVCSAGADVERLPAMGLAHDDPAAGETSPEQHARALSAGSKGMRLDALLECRSMALVVQIDFHCWSETRWKVKALSPRPARRYRPPRDSEAAICAGTPCV